MSDTPLYDDHEDDFEPDPPEFKPELVPSGALGDMFYDGRTGRGLTNEEWDEQRRRLAEHGEDPFGGVQ
jgi:hypothetical protein